MPPLKESIQQMAHSFTAQVKMLENLHNFRFMIDQTKMRIAKSEQQRIHSLHMHVKVLENIHTFRFVKPSHGPFSKIKIDGAFLHYTKTMLGHVHISDLYDVTLFDGPN